MNKKDKKHPRPVLAEGEVTGHFHELTSDVKVVETDEKTKVFNLTAPGTVKHPEHNPVKLPKGDWESDQVLEYDHFEEEARKVQD